MWEETGLLPAQSYRSECKKKFFGKIVVQKGENADTGKTFFTITSADLFDDREQKERLTAEVAAALRFFLKKYDVPFGGKILVVGLGNDKITADSLGSRTVDKLFVTSHFYSEMGARIRYGNLCAVKPGVSGATGIESFDIIEATVKRIKPDLIVAVDTLSCGKSERLGCTVQITDNGIEPGAGVNNPKKKLSFLSLRAPVVAIGVPFVIYVRTILSEYGVVKADPVLASLIVTAKDIDFLISDYSDVLSRAVNTVAHDA